MENSELSVLSFNENSTVQEASELRQKKVKIISWREYTDLLPRLYDKVQYRDFDAIVAIGRGGTMVGSYLASKLGIPKIHSIFVRHVGRGREMKIVADEVDQIKDLHGSLLVVDDWLCEGRAMRYVLNLLPKNASITTLVLFNREGSEFKPDIVGTYLNKDERDIILPYGPIESRVD